MLAKNSALCAAVLVLSGCSSDDTTCDAGSYLKSGSCETCPADQWSMAGSQTECKKCPSTDTGKNNTGKSTTDHTGCTCENKWVFDTHTELCHVGCTETQFWKASDPVGSGACTPCPAKDADNTGNVDPDDLDKCGCLGGKTWNVDASMCKAASSGCATHFTKVKGTDEKEYCVCEPGFGGSKGYLASAALPDGYACAPCGDSKYNKASPANDTAANACTACPTANGTGKSTDPATACKCNETYAWNSALSPPACAIACPSQADETMAAANFVADETHTLCNCGAGHTGAMSFDLFTQNSANNACAKCAAESYNVKVSTKAAIAPACILCSSIDGASGASEPETAGTKCACTAPKEWVKSDTPGTKGTCAAVRLLNIFV